MYYGIAGVVSLALSLLFWWGYSGPYRLVAELQSWLWGVNVINLSLLVCWAALYVPLHALVARVERRFGVRREPVSWTRLVALLNFFFEQRPGQLAGIGLIVLGMGGWFLATSLTRGPLTTFTMAQAQRGERPASRYVRLTGAQVLTGSELSYKRDSSVEHYYPVLPKQEAAGRIRAFVRLERGASAPPDEIVGTLEFDGLPRPLRARVEEKNLLAADYFVIEHGRTPASQSSAAAILVGIGGALMAAGFLWWKAQRTSAKPPNA